MCKPQLYADPALLFFLQPIGIRPCERFDQLSFTVINVACGA
jgi:hypothetical protein